MNRRSFMKKVGGALSGCGCSGIAGQENNMINIVPVSIQILNGRDKGLMNPYLIYQIC